MSIVWPDTVTLLGIVGVLILAVVIIVNGISADIEMRRKRRPEKKYGINTYDGRGRR